MGLALLLSLCLVFSESRVNVRLRIVIKSFLLQTLLALILLKLPASQGLFVFLNDGISVLQAATKAGTSFIFGYLGGEALPFQTSNQGDGFILAFQAMPLIIVVSVISSVLMYLKILPLIMRGFSFILEKTIEVGGAVGLGVSANAFLGMIESPLLIKHYLEKISRGELFAIMVAGMATIAGTMLALESAIISSVVPNAIGHLISCSLITLPAAIYIAHIFVPDNSSVTTGDAASERGAESFIDAITVGTSNGLQIFLNVIAMIIVIVALVFLVNAFLGVLPEIDGEATTLERVLGFLLIPLTMMMGIPYEQAFIAGQLMGTKLVLTEFIAYVRLGDLPLDAMSERTRIIMTYALCGFANFVSLGIMVSGLITLVPKRKQEIINLGLKSLIAGTVATCTTATLVGIIITI
ncbi:MAG: nucleoside transporter C-terminal domain-containing protein [Pseudomonadota bacterium]|nr:nucleoside transporter C-terminal domain-containing protein [Pseudomonadota bacterium]